jgi:lysophospholipase L1-like esterase
MTTPAEQLAIRTKQSELNSFFIDKMGLISVKSYGAKGDGVTDDTAAVTAAKTAASAAGAKSLYFPRGVYNVDSGLDLSGFFLWGDNSSFAGISDTIAQVADFASGADFNALKADIAKQTPIVYNVKGYGAKGDGITDDTEAIQDAIDAAVSDGASIVFFSAGTYKVTGLTDLDKVNLIGDNAVFDGIENKIQHMGKSSPTFHASKFISKLQNGEAATVVFLGDSTTEHNATADPNHVDLFETWLDDLYPGLVTVVNAGVSGNNVNQMWQRSWVNVMVHNPDLVIISSGINDQGGAIQLTPTQFRDNYSRLIEDILSQSECDIILRTPNITQTPATNTALEDYVYVTAALAKKYNLGYFDLFSLMQYDVSIGKIVLSALMTDNVHPNTAGHQYIFDNFKTYFIPKDDVQKPRYNYRMLSVNGGVRLLNSGASLVASDNGMNGYILAFNNPGKKIEFEFYGSAFTIVYTAAASTGQFKPFIDGVEQDIIDTYSATTNVRAYVSYTLTPGIHKIEIEHQATKNAASSGTNTQIHGIVFTREVAANNEVIPGYQYNYVAITKSTALSLTTSTDTVFTFDTVVNNFGVVTTNGGTGEITIEKRGYYLIQFDNRVTTTEEKVIIALLKRNGVTLRNYYGRTTSTVGNQTINVDLTYMVELSAGDVLTFFLNAGGATPTSVSSVVIHKLV